MAEPTAAQPRLPLLSAILIPALALGLLIWIAWQKDSLLLASSITPDGAEGIWADKLIWAAFTLCAHLMVYRLAAVLVIDGMMRRSLGRPVPRILKDVVGVLFFVAAVLVATQILFSEIFSSVLALSGIIGIVVGLAIRPIILDAFSGLSANLESAFQIGDWVNIQDGSISYSGWVDQINWRTTNIRTREGNMIVCPNSTFGSSVVINHSRPQPLSRYEVEIKLPPEYPTEKAVSLLQQAVEATLSQPDGPDGGRAPDVVIKHMTDSGIAYRVRFWVNPAAKSYDTAIHLVHVSIQRHLRFAGVRLASEREEVELGRARPARAHFDNATDRMAILESLPLLAGLNRSTLRALADGLEVKWFDAGQALVSEDDTSTSMFILVEGRLQITKQANGQTLRLSTLHPGDYFGEMALLTGEPRSATITSEMPCRVFEIDRATMQAILVADSEVMHVLSQNLARRQAANQRVVTAASQAPVGMAESRASQILARMKALFSLSRAPFQS